MSHVQMCGPPGKGVYDYLSSDPPPQNLPIQFLDSMVVRRHVFVDEQNCRLENEIDDDDPRSWHWVVYASVATRRDSSSAAAKPVVTRGFGASGGPPPAGEAARRPSNPAPIPPGTLDNFAFRLARGGAVPVATVRAVPPPHAAHPEPGAVDPHLIPPPDPTATGKEALRVDRATRFHDGRELYVKLGRLAAVKEYRGMKLGRQVVDAALEWLHKSLDGGSNGGGGGSGGSSGSGGNNDGLGKEGINVLPTDPAERERLYTQEGMSADDFKWKGLVLVHSQLSAKRFWASCGFEEDEELGRWTEEGIEHVAMWRRVGSKKSE